MVFSASTYANFVSEKPASQTRLFKTYEGSRDDFDVIIVGSGVGGGILADDLAERIGKHKRILVLEAGSYLYPTHIYNVCRFPNSSVARHFACKTFRQSGNEGTEDYIHEQPQLNFGGRSIWWSGLIPHIQPWELDFFPERVRRDLENKLLNRAGAIMNESSSMGTVAQQIVNKFRQSSLVDDFIIEETPRALHQPYLDQSGIPKQDFYTEPTGVFNTAELLINQVGLTPGVSWDDGPGLHLLLNNFVEGVEQINDGPLRYRVTSTDTINHIPRSFRAKTVILAGGSIESPKLLHRSPVFNTLSPGVQSLVGVGLTDHPTTHELNSFITHMGNDLAIPPTAHAKIILYSRGHRVPDTNEIRYPFNVEININHEYWHLRDNDPTERASSSGGGGGNSRIDFKFSFANPIYGGNRIDLSSSNYVPNMHFRNLSWASHLADSRFPALAGWNKSIDQIWAVLNSVSHKIFSQFTFHGQPARPEGEKWFGKHGKGFGMGTVHHAAGSLRMPFRWTGRHEFAEESVVDEDLQVRGLEGLYVCDMSVMPLSSAANPVRTLVGLGLRLGERLGGLV
ncbi:hypothetical protein VTJ49DRAFT_3770 [Mycothermus thermophilus]|uniref:Glucose-methanol-choline oxidoreductase C-terminal domain-containing protein n=1 Tax=Humicola insolens TaxID=85995 RepID=A0ABR3V6R3_HUMIN